ncbi:hypothetical protein BKA62DRAFT_462465 [Auriculariales sp. MPI-PUGE-AT-0066]|nr:hypothetical protein BKA62DRAFT_462465 [Auriculariales sp. MPI-PUGE-AT-0066]
MLAYGEEWQDESTADSVDLKAMQPLARFQHVAGHILAQVQQGRRWDHLKARRDAMAEYSKLAIPAALDSLRFQLDGPKYMSPKQEEIVNKLLLVLSSRDLAYLRAKGDLDLRQAFPVHVQNYCDGCHKSPITNERYDCLDCKADDYQLCRDCVHLPTKKHPFSEESHSVEHNMSLFRFEIPEARAVRFRGAREAMKHCIPAPRYSEGNSETDGKGELLPEICMECKKEMNGQFFTCRSCPRKPELSDTSAKFQPTDGTRRTKQANVHPV